MNVALDWQISAFTALLLLALLLTVTWTIKLSLQRLAKASLLYKTLVTGVNLAVAMTLAIILIQPSVPTSKTQSVVLLTVGAENQPSAWQQAIADRAPVYITEAFYNSPEYANSLVEELAAQDIHPTPLLVMGQLSALEPGLRQIRVIGDGLDAQQWSQIGNNTNIEWQNPGFEGFADVRLPRYSLLGNTVTLSGRYTQTDTSASGRIFTLNLMDPSGTEVASKRIRVNDVFSLSFQPKAPGNLIYQLQLRDDNQQVLRDEPIALQMQHQLPLNISVMQSSPSFEVRQMMNWAKYHGSQMRLQTAISKDRFLHQNVNQEADAENFELSAAQLAQSQLLVMDGRTLVNLDEAQQTLLIRAVKQGLGLFVLVDEAMLEQQDVISDALMPGLILEADTVRREIVPAWPGNTNDMLFQPLPIKMQMAGSRDLITSLRAPALSVVVKNGQGMIALSRLRQRHQWLTSGNRETYTSYWSYVFSQVARKQQNPGVYLPDNALARIDAPFYLCSENAPVGTQLFWQTSSAPQSQHKVNMAADDLGSAQSCAQLLVQQAGWQQLQLRTNNDEQVKQFVYVYAKSAWQDLQRLERLRATENRQRHATQPESAELSAPEPISMFWPWLIMLICSTFLWVERKMFSLR